MTQRLGVQEIAWSNPRQRPFFMLKSLLVRPLNPVRKNLRDAVQVLA